MVLLLQLLWTCTPPLQWLFSSEALGMGHWGLIWLAGGIIFLLIEIEKAVWRRVDG